MMAQSQRGTKQRKTKHPIVTAPRVSAQSPPGFLSIDVGSTETVNYTDPKTGIVWIPDNILWPQIADWSTTSTLGPQSADFTDQKQYQSFRYFKPPPKSAGLTSPTKFCYSLPAQANKYYLIRVTFWCGTSLASASTRVPGVLSFYIIINSYVGPRIDVSLPQTVLSVEEFYVQALNGSTINLCFSAESDVSDAPFVNTIELRPLVDKLNAIKALNSSNSSLRAMVRYDLGAADGRPPIIRYEGNNFLCLVTNASCGLSTPISSKTKNHTPLIIGIVCFVLVVLSFIVVACICMRKRQQTSQPSRSHEKTTQQSTTKIDYLDHVLSDTKVLEATTVAQIFSFEDMQIATDNFTMILGEGCSSVVYKGILRNGVVVAVKVLYDASLDGVEEILDEVNLLSQVHHKNLVKLVGYCIHKNLMLVYEFISEGSFFDALFGNTRTTSLMWRERLQILLDAAQGLAFLHTGCNSLIIHKHVKSSNILLTKRLEGKMSDFGITRRKANGYNLTTRFTSNMGYLDPEYIARFKLTEKVDVYSFGIVLLEAICGQLPLLKDTKTRNTDIHICEWVKPYYKQGEIEKIVDKRLGNEYNVSSVWKVAHIAMACVHYEGSM